MARGSATGARSGVRGSGVLVPVQRAHPGEARLPQQAPSTTFFQVELRSRLANGMKPVRNAERPRCARLQSSPRQSEFLPGFQRLPCTPRLQKTLLNPEVSLHTYNIL